MSNNVTAIQSKYGEYVFQLSLIQLFEKGIEYFNGMDMESSRKKILGSKSKGAILMPEIEAEIVCCAIELSKVPIDEIIKFIKSDLNLRNVVVHAGLIVEFRQNATEEHITMRIVKGEISAEMISVIEEIIVQKLDEYEAKHGDCYGFQYETAIDQAFMEAGVEFNNYMPDKIVYI